LNYYLFHRNRQFGYHETRIGYVPRVSLLLLDDTLQSGIIVNRTQVKLNVGLGINQRKGIVLPVFRTTKKGFIDASAKLRKPPARMERLDSHWTNFRAIWYLSILRKSVEKIQVLLKSDNNNGSFI
jgi:hypothetical protein